MALFTARRASAVVASAAAITLGVAGTASAHHCFKVDWSQAAYEQHIQGNTPWMPLSDLFDLYVAPDIFAGYPDCQGTGDRAVEVFLGASGITQEPLIHGKATIGTGEKPHPKGKQPRSIDYLGNYEDAMNAAVITVGNECGFVWPTEG